MSSYLNSLKIIKKKNLLSQKNFLYFFLILNFFFKSNKLLYFKKINFFFKKCKNNFKTILNSPNRHKISLTKLQFTYFLFFINIFLNIKKKINKLLNYFLFYLNIFNLFFLFFESYLLTLKKKKFIFFFKLNYKSLLK